MNKPKKDTNRIAKVNSLIQHELGPILHEFFAGEKGLITISKVETSRDMKWAKVWISIFNGSQQQTKNNEAQAPSPVDVSEQGKKGLTSFDAKILNKIKANIYEIQGEMNKHFATKIIPRLQFFLDTSPRYVQRIDELIKKIHSENEQE